jgi:hypothetical protein
MHTGNLYFILENQLWPTILEKALAIAVGGYKNLGVLSVG